MAIPQIDPEEAHRRMGQGFIYLDVRSTVEFARGHAVGALNVPLLDVDATGTMVPNPDFLAVCEANFPKDVQLVVGCAAGGRSQRACELLQERGYPTLANIQGGFSGAHDQEGRVVAAGWADLSLPVSTETGEGVGYTGLAKKAGK